MLRRRGTWAASRRLFNVAAILGGAGHNGFERWAGVGVFLEPWLGRRATNVLWSIVPILTLRAVARDRPADRAVLAFNAGMSVAAVVVHFIDWPWSRRLGVVPWLDEAEGLDAAMLPAYNSVLWLWGIGGAGSVLTTTRGKDLMWVAAGMATGPLLLASARHHFAWARQRALHDRESTWSSAFRAEVN